MSDQARYPTTFSPTFILPLLVVIGAFNVVLRVPDTSVSGFYVSAPFVISWIWSTSAEARARAIGVGLIIGYGWVVGLTYGTPLRDMASQTVFYFLALTMVELLLSWKRNSASFEQDAERLMDVLAAAALLIFVLQMLFDFDVPGTWGYRQYGYGTAYFYTPNDLALFLSAYLILVLFGEKPLASKVVIAFSVLLINVVNDARAALLVCVIAPFTAMAMPFLVRRFAYPVLVFVAGGVFLAGAGLAGAVFFSIDDAESALEAFGRVTNLDPFLLPGSVFNRTDALIFNLIEMGKSWWLGMGPGGTVHVLTMPQYDAMTAQSLHNAIAELVFDLGPAFYIPFAAVFALMLTRYLLAERLEPAELGRFTFLLCLPLLSIIQSSGYISNYAFWAAAVLTFVRTGRKETMPSELS
ncbi:hypothetical protein [Devosia sp. Leaf420]|uniref:hypothetical protein n=1 Tax=Devosia sp. Leaf420 TaxID=1736374 RepID=UPI000AD35D7C|nr:hypothetical protein [Devosia sp. Leaf420]